MSFDSAFLAWLAYLTTLGIDARATLNPPATEAQIAAAEARIGYRLPDDLRALYRIGNGQQDPDAYVARHPGAIVAFLFGNDFISLERALSEYQTWQEIYDEMGPQADTVTVRAGDPVHRYYWHPGWFPFASDWGGNSYAVDLSPAPGGTYGQVIVIGRDEDERRVIASSITAFLADAAVRRPPITQRDGPWIDFDMERGVTR